MRGTENILTIWRSKILEMREVTCLTLKYFDTPQRAMKIYHTDDSGMDLQPHPGSNAPYKDRWYFLNRKEAQESLSSPGLKHFGNPLQQLLGKNV